MKGEKKYMKDPVHQPFENKTKDQLWSLNAAQQVGNIMF